MSKNVQTDIRKKFATSFFSIDDIIEERGQLIPTTLSLDIGLKGGLMDGTIGLVSGGTGSGKTTLLLTIAANAQKLGKKIYWDDVENRLQPDLLKTIEGLETTPDKFEIIKSSKDQFLTAEDNYNIIESLMKNEPNVFVVVDSVAALCDSGAFSVEHGESKKMMSIQTLSYACLRKLTQIVRAQKSVLIGITHIQANPSPYGGGFNEYGGNAWKYFASTRLQCLSSSEYPKDGDKQGRESKFKILKSAIGPGTGEALFYIKYGQGYYKEKDIFNLAVELGLVEMKGSWIQYNGNKVQGEENFIQYLKDNPVESKSLEATIRTLTGIGEPLK